MLETLQQYARFHKVDCVIKKAKNPDRYQVWIDGGVKFESQKSDEVWGFIDRQHLLKKFGLKE